MNVPKYAASLIAHHSQRSASVRCEEPFPPGGGELGASIRGLDWSKTILGPIAGWPRQLKSAISLMLPSKAQVVVFWGPEYIAFYNDAYAPTIGNKHPRALGLPARETWTELWDDLEPLLRQVLETGETVFAKDRPFYIERHGYPENVYFDISYSPIWDDTGAVGGILCIVSETTERVVTQQELVKARERLSLALDAAGMVGTFEWDVQTDTLYSDVRVAELFSVAPLRAEQGAPWAEYLAAIHPEDVDRIARAVNGTVLTGKRYVQEYRVLPKQGSLRWVEARGECLRDDNGKPSRFYGAVVDITEHKKAQERQRLLARETNHRVKNMFALFDAMISLSARSAQTPKEMAQALRGRLAALMRAKDLIRPGILGTEQEGEGTTVNVLVRTLLQPHDDGSSRINISGPDILVGAKAVTSLALALHETATNAIKYGALSQPNGVIRIRWEARAGDFVLEWEEAGGPTITAPPETGGFGGVLTQRSISDQLGGKIEYDWRQSGLKLQMTIPLDRLTL